MRILLTLEYDGTAYAGWQRQENALAVQQVVEEAVSKLVGARTVLFGASRTDAGVHALGQRAHFDTASRIPPDKYAYALNTMLPRDIRVRESRAVPDDFHARFSAVGKRYRYQIYAAPHAGALNRNTHAHVIYPLDAEKMRAELPALLGEHDFAAFAASGSVVKDTVRTITRAELLGDGRNTRSLSRARAFCTTWCASSPARSSAWARASWSRARFPARWPQRVGSTWASPPPRTALR